MTSLATIQPHKVQPPVVCTSWCTHGNGHPGERHRDDQYCYSEDVEIPLTLIPQVEMGDGSWTPDSMRLLVRRDVGAVPCVVLSNEELAKEWELKPAESRRLAVTLLQMAELAEKD